MNLFRGSSDQPPGYKQALIGFAGFGGVEIAMREFGIEATGIEIDPAIVEVNRHNGGHCLWADLLDIDPADYEGWRVYHFSTLCPRFSVARNSKARQPLRERVLDLGHHQRIVNGEMEQDLALARKIGEFIKVGRPEFFTLENVWQYRNSLSWLTIWYALLEGGYSVGVWHLNAADYGVPQSRRRMIVIARRDGRPPAKPWPTHSKAGDMFTQPWRGWYSAIENLIPSLPESQFAPWQMDRLPEEMKTFLMMTGNTGRDGIGNKPGRGCIPKKRPANTVPTYSGGVTIPRAFLVPGDNCSGNTVRSSDEPMVTIQTRPPSRCPHRAFILGQGSRSELKAGDEPLFTVTTNEKTAPAKAFIVDATRISPIRSEERPAFTVVASPKGTIRVGLTSGRVVSMTPRALARFQNFPDSFVLPGEPGLAENIVLLSDPRTDRELACYGIGNALPPGVYRAVLKSLGIGG